MQRLPYVALVLWLVAATPAAAQSRAAERQQLRQEVARGQWVQRERWLPAGQKKDLSLGALKVTKVGRATLVRAYVPAQRDGRPGFVVHQLYRAGPKIGATRGRASEEARSQRAFMQMVQLARTEFLREPALAALYDSALASIKDRADVDRVTVYRAAMRGLARGLKDAHTTYLAPSGGQQYLGQHRPESVGCGAMLLQQPTGGVVVKRVFPGSPARRAGLRVGDKVTAVDGQAVANMPQAMELLRKEGGSQVRLDVVRRGTPRSVAVTIGPYNPYPVTSMLARGGLGVVRLPKFYEGAAGDVLRAIERLEARNGRALGGLVLDLRGNPGGVRSEWLELVQQFVAHGSLGSNRGQGGRVVRQFTANPTVARRAKLPLAILVNDESASAAERVAGVLQDRGRALVIGEPTVGKHSGQRVQELADGSVFKLTHVQFHLPGGQQAGKIVPDVTSQAAKQALWREPRMRRAVDPVLRYAIDRLRSAAR
jgi:carboxyl-terminal processing protease